MVRIKIDGTFYEVSADRNLLETCLALGFEIPYFCNHPALGSVGACRLCAVKKYANANDKTGRIVMSCMEPVTEGLIISVEDPEAKAFRAGVIEGLMLNHPHDCPVCDEGGECHLQDMTVMTGHNYRRFTFKKRTYTNQDLGPFIHHEMNRCIQCYRCVRFYRDYAGGTDLNVFGSANHVYFGRQKSGVLESGLSGNLVEVCPTGVFTDKTLKKHYTRKWDLTNAPSVCVHCSLGCNIIVSERYATVRRVMSRYNGTVNGYFICDRGRFGYEFINHPERITKIKIRASKNTNLQDIGGNEEIWLSYIPKGGKMIGIGSPRASLEANYALSLLVGKDNFFHGIPGKEQVLVKKAVRLMESGIADLPSLKEIENCDAVLILAEDVTNTAPMLALAIRQAAGKKAVEIANKLGIPKWNDAAVREMDQGTKSPLFIGSPYHTNLDELSQETFYYAPEDIARLGFAVASEIDGRAPLVQDQDTALQKGARLIADTLSSAKNPLIVTGMSGGNEDILNASANIMTALSNNGKKASFSFVFQDCNSVGLAMLDGKSLDDAIELINEIHTDTLIILENDLYRRTSKEKIKTIINKCGQVIVLDHLMNDTTNSADILLPAAVFAESDGTMVNNEGRAQRFYNVLPPKEPVKESWRWISDIMKNSSGHEENAWDKFDDVVASLTNSYPALSGIKDKMPDADVRFFNEKIPRQNKRFSGRTSMNADVSVSEAVPPADNNSPLDFSMEGYNGNPPSSLIPYYWSPGWNSSQSMFKYMEEPGGALKEGGDPGVKLFPEGSKTVVEYFKDIPATFAPGQDELLIVPVHLIFGSEELSSKGEAISGRIPEPYIILNEREIERLGLIEYKILILTINQIEIKVKVNIDNALPDGVAGLSCLTPGMPYLGLPDRGKILNTGIE